MKRARIGQEYLELSLHDGRPNQEMYYIYRVALMEKELTTVEDALQCFETLVLQ